MGWRRHSDFFTALHCKRCTSFLLRIHWLGHQNTVVWRLRNSQSPEGIWWALSLSFPVSWVFPDCLLHSSSTYLLYQLESQGPPYHENANSLQKPPELPSQISLLLPYESHVPYLKAASIVHYFSFLLCFAKWRQCPEIILILSREEEFCAISSQS